MLFFVHFFKEKYYLCIVLEEKGKILQMVI